MDILKNIYKTKWKLSNAVLKSEFINPVALPKWQITIYLI